MTDRSPPPVFTNGSLAHGLIEQHLQRVVKCHQRVLDREDPEPLHQMRVAMRRLRTTLQQFAPLLDLPSAVTDSRLAKSVRRLGLARDLDVLQGRLVETLMPQLPEAEVAALRPVLRTLRRERDLAQEHLEKVIRSSGHLELVAALQRWLKAPGFTPLADQPADEWMVEWQLPFLQALMLHPGWLAPSYSADADTLHDLRKQIKTARYRLENLAPFTGGNLAPVIGRLRQSQDLLGELNDLQVLRKAIDDQVPSALDQSLPQLHWLLEQNSRRCWTLWREQVDLLWPPRRRTRLPLAVMRASQPSGPLNTVKGGLMRLLLVFG
jgi:CHAD domain-containing protein